MAETQPSEAARRARGRILPAKEKRAAARGDLFVRLMRRAHGKWVEVEFGIASAGIHVDLMLPEAELADFCARYGIEPPAARSATPRPHRGRNRS